MEVSQESPRSVIGHEEEGFPRKRAAVPDNQREDMKSRERIKMEIAEVSENAWPESLSALHEDYLKAVSSSSPVWWSTPYLFSIRRVSYISLFYRHALQLQ